MHCALCSVKNVVCSVKNEVCTLHRKLCSVRRVACPEGGGLWAWGSGDIQMGTPGAALYKVSLLNSTLCTVHSTVNTIVKYTSHIIVNYTLYTVDYCAQYILHY